MVAIALQFLSTQSKGLTQTTFVPIAGHGRSQLLSYTEPNARIVQRIFFRIKNQTIIRNRLARGIDNVKFRLHRSLRCLDIPILKFGDLVLIRFVLVIGDRPIRCGLCRRTGHGPSLQIRRRRAHMPKLNASKRPPFVKAIAHMPQIYDIAVIP